MRDTRQEIITTAKALFNERGYNDVSTRDIADSLGISKGNLTYYFKKKEEIIEAIVTENPSTRKLEPPKTLLEMHAFFKDIQKTVQENAFYFWHHAQLAQISPKIRSLQADTFKDNTRILADSFRVFAEKGLIRSELYPGEYKKTIDALLLTSVYWVPFCELKEDHEHKGFQQQAWSIMFPLLTDEGVKAFGT